MIFSYSLRRCYHSILILAIQIFLITYSVSSLNLTNEYLNHKCFGSEGKYNPGSKYEENLNTLFETISSRNYSILGYSDTSTGEPPNSINIRLLCRFDSYFNCSSCAAIAAAEYRKRCPRNKGGIIWYDQCSLDINIKSSNTQKLGYENIVSMHNPKKVNGNIELFDKMTRVFLYNLTLQADKLNAKQGLEFFYASGETKIEMKKLYAMVQCMPTKPDCKGCLEWSIRVLSKCCGGKQGARVLGSNCNLRYELYPFYRT